MPEKLPPQKSVITREEAMIRFRIRQAKREEILDAMNRLMAITPRCDPALFDQVRALLVREGFRDGTSTRYEMIYVGETTGLQPYEHIKAITNGQCQDCDE